jgi:MATE family multidrug resistance protein
VGLAFGAGDGPGTARAGWVSVGLSLAFMGAIALVFVALPGPLTGLFLDRADPANHAALGHAVRFLGVAALFQLVDGAQVTGAAALRGLGDTRAPMLIALGGYWAVGVPTAYAFGFGLGMGGVGVWLGLAVALALVAVALCRRFARLTGTSSPLSQPA